MPNRSGGLGKKHRREIEGIGGTVTRNIGGNKVRFQLASIKKDINNRNSFVVNNGGLLWARGKNRT